MNWGDQRLPERFWKKAVPEPNSGCWLWVGAHDQKGYGFIQVSDRAVRAHRFSFLVENQIPPGLQVDHLCKQKCCVNPAHLEAVTPRTNSLRSENQAAKNARKTHCPNGHEYTPDNLRTSPSYVSKGHRVCIICSRANVRRWERKQGKST